MRLSKKGWNNILIFSGLLIIFIVNFVQKPSIPSTNSQYTAIPSELTILEIETPDYTIYRAGRNWQTSPNLGLSSEKLRVITNNWQTLLLDRAMEQGPSDSPFVIKIFVAEQQQPLIVQLYQQPDNHYILQIDNLSFLKLPSEKLPLYLGI